MALEFFNIKNKVVDIGLKSHKPVPSLRGIFGGLVTLTKFQAPPN